MKKIIINSEEMQTRVAVVHDGVLHDFFMDRNERNDQLVGSIFKGRIRNLEPSLQAAFVDIGTGKNAFLHYWDMIPATQETWEKDEPNDESGEDEAIPAAAPQQAQQPQRPKPQNQQAQQPRRPPQNQNQNQRQQQRQRRGQQQPQQPKKKGILATIRGWFSSAQKKSVKVPVQQTGQENRAQRKGGVQAQANGGARPQPQQKQQARQQPKKPPQPSVEDIPNLFHEDQEILVQVTKGPIGTKGARVTTNLSIPGRYLVLLPGSTHNGISRRVEERAERDRLRRMMRELKLPQNMGVICRTVGIGRKLEHFQRDLDLLMDSWNKALQNSQKKAPVCIYQEPPLAERALRDCLTEDIDEIITDSPAVFNRAQELMTRYNMQVKVKLYSDPTPIFNRYGLTPQLESVFSRKVNLPSGGYLCIDETEALIAIDVNTGKNRSGKDQPETILKTNLEAVQEIARQLRLRNVGGLVVLDLIDMRQQKDRTEVFRKLKECLSEDHAKTRAYPISALGLVEMTRQRENESLESTIFDNCPYCKGRGLIKSPESMSVEIQRRLNEVVAKRKCKKVIVKAHTRVVERLEKEDRKLFETIEKQYQMQILFEKDPSLHIEDFHLFDAANESEMQRI